MFPASTHKGQAVLGFPDVCKTPSPAGPVPIAFPNIAMQTSQTSFKTAGATKTATKSSMTKTSGNEAGYRSHLGILHQRLMSAPVRDATGWHALLDEYVMTSAELYKSLASR